MPESKTPMGSVDISVCIRFGLLCGGVAGFKRIGSALDSFVQHGMHSNGRNVPAQVGDGGFICGGGDGGGRLVIAAAGDGVAVSAHAFEDGAGEGIAEWRGGDEASIDGMVHEAALEEHADINDVAVFGIPDEEWGEAVHAILVLRKGAVLSKDEITAYARTKLAGYKVPRSLSFMDEIPRNGSGKILKRDLRKPFWEGRKSRV